ncbi:MAG: DUF2182 domain-containing protein [Sporichthyaceae bacterium]
MVATPMSRARTGILLGLIALTAASWWYLLTADMGEHATTPTMGLGALLFLAVWVAMMIATMFPAVAPMILMFARLAATKRTAGKAYVPTWLFVLGYLVVWTALGVGAYVLAVGAERLASNLAWVDENTGRIGGAVVVVAGAYQFGRLKDRCLTECRSPMAFVMQHWREGRLGAVRMGVHHGWHCAGCCWALMALMFPLGMMNVAALAGVTALVYVEKVLPNGRRLGRMAGVALVGLGLLVLARPEVLPSHSGEVEHHGSHAQH